MSESPPADREAALLARQRTITYRALRVGYQLLSNVAPIKGSLRVIRDLYLRADEGVPAKEMIQQFVAARPPATGADTSATVSEALDKRFERPAGLYGKMEDIPVIAQAGHYRRMAILDALKIGDVTQLECVDFGMGGWGFACLYPKLHHCRRAIGLDISRSALEQAQKVVDDTKPPYADKLTLLQSDGMQLPIPDSSVDLIFAGESIEHVRYPRTFLSECYRVLRPKGQLVLTTPNREAFLYHQVGEEYCSSPEHFWLFNRRELVETVSEFFEIEEEVGFNGTLGPELDRAFDSRILADRWAACFADRPEFASGIIMRVVRKEGVRHRYDIETVPASAVTVPPLPRYLDLEFGLKGLLLEQPEQEISIVRPPSDGVVIRFWSHRWSGYARILTSSGAHDRDLYSFHSGWRCWESCEPTTSPQTITIRREKKKTAASLDDQVIFFETFTWKKNPHSSR